jgi:ribosomal small subunit protein bTHX
MGKGDKKTKKGKISKKSFGNKRLKNKSSRQLIKPKDFRKWSRERLYFEIGRFDYTITITFKHNSDSFKKFGKMIIGILYYTKKERHLLKIKLNSGVKYQTDGKILFTTLIKEGLTEEQISLLFTEGFNNIDILNADCYAYKRNQTYFRKKKKKLEEPLVIKIKDDLGNLKSLKMIYQLFKRRIDQSDDLIDFEKLKMMAIQKALEIVEIDPIYIHSDLVKERKVEYDFLVEDTLIDIDKIKAYSDVMLKNKLELSKKIVDNEFAKAGINPERPIEMLEHLGLYAGLTQIGITYEDEIILYGTNPKIILDFKGFMHIVFRHCNICNIGKYNEDKSRIPYELMDIKDLVKSCLHLLAQDIDSHFAKNPNKRFSRYGDRLIRFNGDYYEIHINTNGVIETFYNHEK